MGCSYGKQSAVRLRGGGSVATRCGGFGQPTAAIRVEAQKTQYERRGQAGLKIVNAIDIHFNKSVHVNVRGEEVESRATVHLWSEIEISLKGDRQGTLLIAFNRQSPDVLYRIINNSDGTIDINGIKLAETILSHVAMDLKNLGPGGTRYYEDKHGRPIYAFDPRIAAVQRIRRSMDKGPRPPR